MPQVGPLEIIVVAVLALIVFGPQRLPEIARTVGRALNEMRRMANEVKQEFREGLDDPVDDEVDVPPGGRREAGTSETPEAPEAPDGHPRATDDPPTSSAPDAP